MTYPHQELHGIFGLPRRSSAVGRPDHNRTRGTKMAEMKVAERRKAVKYPAILGRTFGHWTVIAHAGWRGPAGTKRYVLCRCACGVEKEISAGSVTTGQSTSCGCAQLAGQTTHGRTGSREYRIWQAVKARCLNENNTAFKDYGGRGIGICQEWADDFMAFYRHVGACPTSEHTIDRIDNNRGYEPGNCRWATRLEQGRNRRGLHQITYGGRTQCLQEWADEFGLSPRTLHNRIKRGGWTFEKALTTPPWTRECR